MEKKPWQHHRLELCVSKCIYTLQLKFKQSLVLGAAAVSWGSQADAEDHRETYSLLVKDKKELFLT